jgi:hypothetical protein
MVLSKRERIIAIVTLAIILMFVLDRYAVTPLMEMNDNIRIEKQNLVVDIQRASRIFKERKQVSSEWNDMERSGLSSDPSDTESKVLHVIRKWSNDYGLTISSIKPDRNGDESKILKEIIFNIACKGTMDAVGRFLLELENSSLPIRITEFQLGSREEDGMDMSLQLRLSALYFSDVTNPILHDNDEAVNEEVKI